MFPVLFTLGWIDVPSFTALMALALGVGLGLTWWRARRMGLPSSDVLDVAFVAVLVGVVGARAGYVVAHWDYFQVVRVEIAALWRGGLSWHGGLLGGAAGVLIGCAWRRLAVRRSQVLDALAPGLMAGAALGWIGAYLAGVAYGRPILPGDRWWFLAADLPDEYGLWNPRFITQLLGAAWAAVCFIVAVAIGRFQVENPVDGGQRSEVVSRRSGVGAWTFAVTMALYSVGMFALGFTRGDIVPAFGGWRLDQVMDAGIAVAGVVYGGLKRETSNVEAPPMTPDI